MGFKDFFVGRKSLQPIFERLHRISLRGMNYGLGGMVSTSGESKLIQWIKKQLAEEENLVVFDIGANKGQYATILSRELSSNDNIYCFEPGQSSFKELVRKFKDYKNFTLENIGFGARQETRKLFFDNEGSGWASVYERGDTGFNHHLNKSEDIKITTLDSYRDDKDIKQIHFLKMDVEGFELEILKGAIQSLPRIKYIQFEFSFANYDSRTYLYEFFQILKEFDIYRVLSDGIYPLKYDPRYEIFMTTNYLAVNRNFL